MKSENPMVAKWIVSVLQSIIEFYEPRTLEEAIRKAKYCYEQSKGKPDYHKAFQR